MDVNSQGQQRQEQGSLTDSSAPPAQPMSVLQGSPRPQRQPPSGPAADQSRGELPWDTEEGNGEGLPWESEVNGGDRVGHEPEPARQETAQPTSSELPWDNDPNKSLSWEDHQQPEPASSGQTDSPSLLQEEEDLAWKEKGKTMPWDEPENVGEASPVKPESVAESVAEPVAVTEQIPLPQVPQPAEQAVQTVFPLATPSQPTEQIESPEFTRQVQSPPQSQPQTFESQPALQQQTPVSAEIPQSASQPQIQSPQLQQINSPQPKIHSPQPQKIKSAMPEQDSLPWDNQPEEPLPWETEHEESIPEHEESLPEKEESLPEKEESLPEKEESLPQKEESLPWDSKDEEMPWESKQESMPWEEEVPAPPSNEVSAPAAAPESHQPSAVNAQLPPVAAQSPVTTQPQSPAVQTQPAVSAQEHEEPAEPSWITGDDNDDDDSFLQSLQQEVKKPAEEPAAVQAQAQEQPEPQHEQKSSQPNLSFLEDDDDLLLDDVMDDDLLDDEPAQPQPQVQTHSQQTQYQPQAQQPEQQQQQQYSAQFAQPQKPQQPNMSPAQRQIAAFSQMDSQRNLAQKLEEQKHKSDAYDFPIELMHNQKPVVTRVKSPRNVYSKFERKSPSRVTSRVPSRMGTRTPAPPPMHPPTPMAAVANQQTNAPPAPQAPQIHKVTGFGIQPGPVPQDTIQQGQEVNFSPQGTHRFSGFSPETSPMSTPYQPKVGMYRSQHGSQNGQNPYQPGGQSGRQTPNPYQPGGQPLAQAAAQTSQGAYQPPQPNAFQPQPPVEGAYQTGRQTPNPYQPSGQPPIVQPAVQQQQPQGAYQAPAPEPPQAQPQQVAQPPAQGAYQNEQTPQAQPPQASQSGKPAFFAELPVPANLTKPVAKVRNPYARQTSRKATLSSSMGPMGSMGAMPNQANLVSPRVNPMTSPRSQPSLSLTTNGPRPQSILSPKRSNPYAPAEVGGHARNMSSVKSMPVDPRVVPVPRTTDVVSPANSSTGSFGNGNRPPSFGNSFNAPYAQPLSQQPRQSHFARNPSQYHARVPRLSVSSNGNNSASIDAVYGSQPDSSATVTRSHRKSHSRSFPPPMPASPLAHNAAMAQQGGRPPAFVAAPAPVVVNPENLVRRQWPLFSFSSAGRVASMLPNSDGYGRRIVKIDVDPVSNILDKQQEVFAKFPGPLARTKAKRADLEKWLDDVVDASIDAPVWPLLKVLVSSINGKGDFGSREFREKAIKALSHQVSLAPEGKNGVDPVSLSRVVRNSRRPVEPNCHQLEGTEISNIYALLEEGETRQALELAVGEKDWALALVVAQLMGPEAVAEVVRLMSADRFSQDPAMSYIVGLAGAKSNSGSTSDALPGLDALITGFVPRATGLALCLANCSQPSSALLQLSAVLADDPCTSLMARMLSGTPLMDAPYVSIEALIVHEIYEYVLVSSHNMPPGFAPGFPHSISVLVQHAGWLADMGHFSIAKTYSDAASAAISSRQLPYLPSSLLELNRLSERLAKAPSDLGGEPGWFGGKLGKSHINKVWDHLDKSFNKFVSGEEIPAAPQKPISEVFSNFSTPAVSRSQSALDMHSQYQAMAPMAPIAPAIHNALSRGSPYSAHNPAFGQPPRVPGFSSRHSSSGYLPLAKALDQSTQPSSSRTSPRLPYRMPSVPGINYSPKQAMSSLADRYPARTSSPLAGHVELAKQGLQRLPAPAVTAAPPAPPAPPAPHTRLSEIYLGDGENSTPPPRRPSEGQKQHAESQKPPESHSRIPSNQYPDHARSQPSYSRNSSRGNLLQHSRNSSRGDLLQHSRNSSRGNLAIHSRNSSRTQLSHSRNASAGFKRSVNPYSPISVSSEAEPVSPVTPISAPVQSQRTQPPPPPAVSQKPKSAPPRVDIDPVSMILQNEHLSAESEVKGTPLAGSPDKQSFDRARLDTLRATRSETVTTNITLPSEPETDTVHQDGNGAENGPSPPVTADSDPLSVGSSSATEPPTTERLAKETAPEETKKPDVAPPPQPPKAAVDVTEPNSPVSSPPPRAPKKTSRNNPYAPRRKPVNPYSSMYSRRSSTASQNMSHYAPSVPSVSSPVQQPEELPSMDNVDMYSFGGYHMAGPGEVKKEEKKEDDMIPSESVESAEPSELSETSEPPEHLVNSDMDSVSRDSMGFSRRFTPLYGSAHLEGSPQMPQNMFASPRSLVSSSVPSIADESVVSDMHRSAIFTITEEKRLYATDADNEEYYDDVVSEDDNDDAADKKRKDAEKKKKEEAERKKREEAERKKKEEAEKKKNAAHKQSQSGWFGFLRRSESPRPIRAKMGEENQFVYDEKLKRWVNKSGPTEEQSLGTPPPPPMKKVTQSVPTTPMMPPSGHSKVGGSVSSFAPPRPSNLSSRRPSFESSVSSLGPPAVSTPPMAASTPPRRPGSGPARPKKGGDSIDELLSMSSGSRTSARASRRGRGRKRGYVDVMAKMQK